MPSPKLYLGNTRIGGADQPAVISSSTASSTVNVTIGSQNYRIYKFNGAGSITIVDGGVLDVLLQGGGGPGNIVDGSGGAGGGGGQVEKINIYIPEGTYPVRVGTGTINYLGTSNAAGTSEFYQLVAVGGAPGPQYNDRTPGGGACGASSNARIGPSYGMYYQGRIGSEMRGGNAQETNNGRGGGVAADGGATSATGYDPGTAWGSPGNLGGGGNCGYSMTANTGRGGNNGTNGNSGLVYIRVKI